MFMFIFLAIISVLKASERNGFGGRGSVSGRGRNLSLWSHTASPKRFWVLGGKAVRM
jgi:hypothetical protein